MFTFHESADGIPLLDLRAEGAQHRPDLSELPALSDDERAMAIRTWRGRMVNEHVSARVFASLVPLAMKATVPGAQLAQLAGYVADELRHAEQCAGVVLALGGQPVAPMPDLPDVPVHEDVGPLEALLRNVLSVCCMSETVAVSVIRAEHVELEGTALGRVLTAILADEIQHARWGWGLLGQVKDRLDDNTRARLGRYLVDAFAHQIRWEVPKLPVNPGMRPELAQAGVCDGLDARALFTDTLERVVVPQLEAAGLPARKAWSDARVETGWL